MSSETLCNVHSANWLATILVLAIAQPSLDSPKVFTSESVQFPSGGNVIVTAVARQGEIPHLIFRSPDNAQVLLASNIGSGAGWTSPIDKSDPAWVANRLSFIVLHRPGLPDPLIAALAMSPGGTDCSYRVALFGEVHGRIAELTPELHDHLTRGGDLLAKNAKGIWTLTVYSERYQANDVHVNGPSRMAVSTYTYDMSLGKFIETGHTDMGNLSDLYENPQNLIRLFGDFAQC